MTRPDFETAVILNPEPRTCSVRGHVRETACALRCAHLCCSVYSLPAVLLNWTLGVAKAPRAIVGVHCVNSGVLDVSRENPSPNASQNPRAVCGCPSSGESHRRVQS